MFYLLCSTTDTNVDPAAPPNPELYAAIDRLGREMTSAGKLVLTGSMFPAATGTRVKMANGELSVTDGPHAEAKELAGGFAIISADSREEAVQVARQFQETHRQALGDGYVGETELREMFVADEFGTAHP